MVTHVTALLKFRGHSHVKNTKKKLKLAFKETSFKNTAYTKVPRCHEHIEIGQHFGSSLWHLNTRTLYHWLNVTPTFNNSHSKPQTVWVLGGRRAVNPRPEGHSPGDFVAVHSLAVSGENTLEGRNQHFVQGCMETVKRRKGKIDNEGKGSLYTDQDVCGNQSVTFLRHFTEQL